MLMTSKMVAFLPAFSAVVWSLQTTPTLAGEYSKHAKSGEATRIWSFYSCTTHAPSSPSGAFVEHGSVVYKDATIDRCGNANEPAREVWYTSNAGFKGLDKVTIPWRKRATIIDVTVQ